ncbi:MAG: elongation factor P [Chloroflexi bacterium]|nr:elongation factor P [Chloroflexota bacterium]|tara:strand:+ start:1432 stop:1995 length:564 start_codon:yes stop_codon:yes gene_type:complete
MTIGYGELKKGMSIEIEGEPYSVVDYERSKMQQRAPVMRIRFRNLLTGRVVDKTFSGYDVSFTPADVERRKSQYIYQDGDFYYFMDNESYDQFPMDQGQVAETLDFIVEQMEVDLIFFKGTPITLELPITVDLKVINSPPGVRGDTATGASKEATVETGLVLQVPLFVKEGDVIKIDTRTGQYISRS